MCVVKRGHQTADGLRSKGALFPGERGLNELTTLVSSTGLLGTHHDLDGAGVRCRQSALHA